MYSSTSNNGLLQSAECSGSSSSDVLVYRPMQRQEVSLISLASEEDDEVQFDSKQLSFLYLMVLPNGTSSLLIIGGYQNISVSYLAQLYQNMTSVFQCLKGLLLLSAAKGVVYELYPM